MNKNMTRSTYQKQCVLDVLQAMRGQHPTAEAVYERARRLIPTISLATVYRILNQSAGQKTIARVHVPDSAVRYDDLLAPHHHLLCSRCQRLFDLPPLRLENVPTPQMDIAGHKITGVEFFFRGICSECAADRT